MSYEQKTGLGAQVYAASTIDPDASGAMLVRQIGPHGATGKLIPVRTTYAEPIGGGRIQPVSTSFARRIGPHGAYGPLVPLGTTEHGGGFFVGVGLLALAVLWLVMREPSLRRNPGQPLWARKKVLPHLELLGVDIQQLDEDRGDVLLSIDLPKDAVLAYRLHGGPYHGRTDYYAIRMPADEYGFGELYIVKMYFGGLGEKLEVVSFSDLQKDEPDVAIEIDRTLTRRAHGGSV